MRRMLTPMAALAAVAVVLVAAPAAPATPQEASFLAGADPGAAYAPRELLVRFRSGLSSARRGAVRQAAGGEVIRELPVPGLELIRIPAGISVPVAAAELARDPGVLYAEPNVIYRPAATPNDPRFADQWGLHNTGQTVDAVAGVADADIDAPEAWNTVTGSPSVTVAVIDTGIAYDHPDLAANAWSNPGETGGGKETNGVDDDLDGLVDDWHGWDWVDDDNDPRDGNQAGHGTLVAGAIGAAGNNGVGISGVAWQVKLMPLRVSGATATLDDILSAYDYAADHGADVVNLSLGADGETPLSLAVAVAAAPGTLLVTAAGNDSRNVDTSPESPCDLSRTQANVLCVAATTQSDQLASTSNYGSATVDLGAPGTNILSTLPVPVHVFTDDLETPIAGRWTTGGTNNTWARTDENSASGTYSLTDSPGADYMNNTNSWARIGPFDLSGMWNCRLELTQLTDLEEGSDYLYLEGSTNGGTSWSLIDYFTGATDPEASSGPHNEFPIEDLELLFGSPSSLLLRWRLESGPANVPPLGHDGAYVDDVDLICDEEIFNPSIYGFADGTSLAAPQVAGAAALVLADTPGASPQQVGDALLGGVDPKSSLAGKTVSGGRLNLHRAVDPDVPDDPPPPPPETSIVGGPSGVIGSRAASFDLASSVPGSSFECRLDGAVWSPCSSPKTYNGLGDGTHQFEARAKDTLGVADPTPATRTFTVDTLVPDTTITAGPRKRTRDRTPTLRFTSTEPGSSFECRVDRGAYKPCGSPTTMAVLARRGHSISVRAIDQAGNADQTPAQRWFRVIAK